MSEIDFDALCAPFPYARLSWRIRQRSVDLTRGQVIPYLDSRDIQDRLDLVVGRGNWRDTLTPGPAAGGIFCTLELLIDGQWVGKSDIGYIGLTPSRTKSPERAMEDSLKGSGTEAFKRAAVKWGIGRYLYHFDNSVWVPLVNEGRQLASFPLMPDELLPENERGTEPWKALQEELAKGLHVQSRGVAFPKASRGPQPRAVHTPRLITQILDKPLLGTPEQWQALSMDDRREITVLHNRLQTRTELSDVREFLEGERGACLPSWARDTLLSQLELILNPPAEPAAA